MWLWFLLGLGAVFSAEGAGAGAARLVCYVETARTSDFTECTHLVYAGTARGDKLDGLLKDYRKHNPKLKIVLRLTDEDKDLKDILKSKHIQGVEIHNAHQTFNRTRVSELVEAARSAVSSASKGPLLLALPAHPELLAKYYDLRTLVKKADLMMVQTHALGTVKKMTYHPSRLSGLWDMMNTDSVVDLVIGLGVPASKIVVSLPATARQFTLQNETLSTPGSPTLEEEPREIDQAELCRQLQRGRWTLERDQDLSAPYAFKNSTWISFEDSSSVDVKGKYARVRGLAGLALFRADRDAETPCGGSLRSILYKVLNQQSRAPRAAVLRSLENEILSAGLGAPAGGRVLDALQVSPYRITQVVDSDGVIHSIREDTRTEFSCSRQGYFVHPRSCARFYRCVKFDQYSPDFTVFEFDCPAGLAFDARYEVCVWPGSLPDAGACPGSAEIAPVPATRFLCPKDEGFYVDPENCRWFFACLDHGKSPLTAYEFRCPFGLGFDAARLRCDWPWLVPACGNIGRYEAEAFGFSAATLSGATGFQGRTADSVNVAAHQSLASGAALDNLVGVQSGFLNAQDALDSNFIAAQELDSLGDYQPDYFNLGSQGEPSGLSYKVVAADAINKGLVQATNYDDEDKYTSGSIILDDYRLPTNKGTAYIQSNANAAAKAQAGNALRYDSGQYRGNNVPPKFRTGAYRKDYRGAYVHNPAGDRAKPYQHVDVAPVPYQHININSADTNNFDKGTYHGSYDRGTYSGSYDTGSYKQGATKSSGYDYPKPNVQFNEGLDTSLHTVNSHGYTSIAGAADAESTSTYHGSYGSGDVNTYVTDSRVYPGAPHTLTAGAVNVDLVGKTTLVDESNRSYQYSQGVVHQAHDVLQPDVSISHIGTDSQNLDGYGYVTTPTSSGIPTTATPFAVTTSLPVTYKTTYVPQAPKSSVKQIFGYTQPSVTYVQPTVVAVTPSVQVTDYNQSTNYQNTRYSSLNAGTTKTESTGYDYSRPNIKFEEGITYSTTPTPITVTKLRPQSFSHTQQTIHGQSGHSVYSTATPVREEPFKRVVAYTTGTPVAYVQPTAQSYSQQTVHKTESANVYTPALESGEKLFSTITHETSTPQSISIVPSVESAQFGQQTVHTVDTNKVNTYSQVQSGYEYSQPSSVSYDQSSGYDYNKPSVQYEDQKTVHYSTPIRQSYLASEPARPIVTTAKTLYENPLLKYTVQVTPATYQQTYVPQAFSEQTINRGSAYQYKSTATPIVSVQPTISNYQTQVYNEQNSQRNNQEYGYDYSQPSVSFKESVSTASPVIVSTDQPQVYSQQTIYRGPGRTKFGSSYEYKSTAQPTESVQPSISYQAQGYNEQANYEQGYEYFQPSVRIQEAGTVSPAEPSIVATERPQAYSQQTIHRGSSRKTFGSNSNYQAQAYDTNSQANYESGYEYSQPSLTFKGEDTVSTVTPIVVSTERPQSYSQQTFHRVEKQRIASTPLPHVELTYQRPAVSVYENPILKYAKKVTLTDVRPTVYSQTVKEEVRRPIQYETGQQSYSTQLNQGFSYDQPEIQRNVEISSAPAYSDAAAVSHQSFHQSQTFGKTQQKGKDVVFVSTTPSTLIYEDHYSAYEVPKQRVALNSEYIPAKSQEYYTVSTSSTPLQEQSGYTSGLNQYNIESDSQSTFEVPNKVESVHFSSIPTSSSTSQFNQVRYESPEIQVAYNAEQYLPPVVSTAIPAVTSTSRPRIYSTTVTSQRDYLQPSSETEYSDLEFKPIAKGTSLPPRAEKVETLEYLPPTQKSASRVVNYDKFGNNIDGSAKNIYDFQQDYSISTGESVSSTAAPIQRKQNIVVETAKSHLLGFGTVGPDAGLVSTYTTSQPSVSTENTYFVSNGASSTSTPDIVDVIPATRRTRPKYFRPAVKSTTQTPVYTDSTTYQAPEYLPPTDDVQGNINSFGYNSESASQINFNPYQSAVTENIETLSSTPLYTRKQNIVVETAKYNLLNFGTVESDAGLGAYSTSADLSSTARATPVTSTYSPVRQELVEVTSTRVPLRRTRPKVAVVTKINDFNPLLVRKLGAVCSCQSPVLVLKGRRPTTQIIEDYSSADSSSQEDIDDGNWQQKSIHVTTPISNTVTIAPTVSSTFNPIIVPDDSYYQDYEEARNDNIVINNPYGNGHSEKYVSSTPVVSTTERVVRIRPRVKTVTIAPTYKTVILNEEQPPQESESADTVNVDSQTFDRYGPGGWRSRDETLQGSIDCQRAGLFRHPKQCNKFYACRWDCTKQRFTLHVFNCPVQLSFDPNIGACNWPSQGPACQGDTLLTKTM